jgi:YbgC/YbaW family acyl-CoA thioester hydrolase
MVPHAVRQHAAWPIPAVRGKFPHDLCGRPLIDCRIKPRGAAEAASLSTKSPPASPAGSLNRGNSPVRGKMKTIEYIKPIYTYEIDLAQQVSNIAYIQWMEVGRLSLLEEVGLPIHKIKAKGFVPVLIRTEINYKKPLFMGDEVRVVLWLSALRRRSPRRHVQFIEGART